MLFFPYRPFVASSLGPDLPLQECLAPITTKHRKREGKTRTNHAGGVVGGITNGNELVFRIAIKPTSSTPKEQQTLNLETGNVEAFSVKGRHDLSIALRVPVVLEAVTAIVLTDLMMLEGRIDRIL